MYTNNEWSLEHVWDMTQLTSSNDDYQRRLKEVQKEGDELDMIRSEHLALSSGEQGEEMIRLREENSILHRQLEESHQVITEIRKQAQRDVQQVNRSLKETKQTLQDVEECHQQETRRSNTRLQETQAQLQEMQDQLQDIQVQTQV